jgi:hypothetical protein
VGSGLACVALLLRDPQPIPHSSTAACMPSLVVWNVIVQSYFPPVLVQMVKQDAKKQQQLERERGRSTSRSRGGSRGGSRAGSKRRGKFLDGFHAKLHAVHAAQQFAQTCRRALTPCRLETTTEPTCMLTPVTAPGNAF